jgi:hypothetical protein
MKRLTLTGLILLWASAAYTGLKITDTLQIPNSSTPPSTECDQASETGRIYLDSDAPTGQQFYACEGTAGWVLQGDGGSAGGGGGSGMTVTVSSAPSPGVTFSTVNFNSDFQYAVTGSSVHINFNIPAVLNRSTITTTGTAFGGDVSGTIGATIVADDSHNHSATTLDTDSVSADELNATGVETELEAVLDIGQLQGIIADAQMPNLTGDVTTTEGAVATTIADNSVDGTDIALGSDASGDVMYYDGTNWVRLPKGTAGQVLEMNAGETAPEWDTDDTSAAGTDDGESHIVFATGSPTGFHVAITSSPTTLILSSATHLGSLQGGSTAYYELNPASVTLQGNTLGGDISGTLGAVVVANDSHAHTGASLSGIDVSDDVNLTAGDGLTLTGDDIDFDGGDTPAGDLGGTWASPSVTDDSHAHTSASLSGIDISADTNLAVTTPIVLTNDTLTLATLPIGLLTVGASTYWNYPSSGTLVAPDILSTATIRVATITVIGGALNGPAGTNPTIDANGEINIDTTDNQFLYYSGAARVIPYTYEKCVAVSSAAINATNVPIFFPLDAITITSQYCMVQGGTSAAMVISDGTNSLESITCDADGAADDGSLTNASFTANERMELDMGTISGTVAWATMCIRYVIDRQ